MSFHPAAGSEPKSLNNTLLKAAPAYIKAIMAPGDTSFHRLQCPSPSLTRYHYLQAKGSATGSVDPHPPLQYFFALDLTQCAHVLPRLLGSIVEAMQILGPRHCALSIVEGRSSDGTYEILMLLRDEIERLGAKYFFQTNEINPKAPGTDRIVGLAQLRNQALQPLLDDLSSTPKSPDLAIVFLNDVAICTEDILELLHQRLRQSAHMVCAMDWIFIGRNPTFYDLWIARGINGDSFFKVPADGSWDLSWNLFWNNPEAQQRVLQGLPFQVYSCWNGAVAFTAQPVLERKVRFRAAYDKECPQGEPTNFCKDLWLGGYGRIAVVPSVNLAYDNMRAMLIKGLKGYVSTWVDGIQVDDSVEWVEEPPEKVKCIPSYDKQTWPPWDEGVLENKNSTHL